ncbi:hypothetical protein [Lederbergia lenta]|uniref:hypothetical protein n=1 Tax=Lederbergia lenta TaxID=1467 RepID=UPI00203B9D7A|nr:hypothetical protein [Lederbergia lenta]MCM3112739.1 hypothetical protein [Lederbergia lenta]
MNLEKEFMTRFLVYPIAFLLSVTILCTIRNNWEDLEMTLKIILAYYIFMSVWFYFDLKQINKKD